VTGKDPDRIDTPYLDDGVWSFMEECWNREPNERPAAQQAVDFFKVQVPDVGDIDIRPTMEWDYST